MVKITLLSTIVLYGLLDGAYSMTMPPTPPTFVTIQPGCHRDGKFYKEGSSFKPSACEWCQCVQGRPRCLIADCFIVQCVDSYHDPTKCCPVCPNGKTNNFNILLKTLILHHRHCGAVFNIYFIGFQALYSWFISAVRWKENISEPWEIFQWNFLGTCLCWDRKIAQRCLWISTIRGQRDTSLWFLFCVQKHRL